MITLRQRAKPERRLATVLFTDIVRSTELLSEVGDVQWRGIISEHHAIVRRALKRYGGRELDTAGDGFLAEFPRPLPAIECALEVVQELHEAGIEIRCGIHMGEVEVIGPKLGGMAVHIGARIAAKAEAGEVLVSGTIRDLVAGADLLFADRGEHELKGVPGAWRIFVVRPRVHAAPKRPRPAAPVAAAPRRLGRAQLGAIAAALVVVVAVAGYGVARVVGAGKLAPVLVANGIGRLDPASGQLDAAVRVGNKPGAITSGGGYIWVVNTADQTLAQVDPSTVSVATTRSVNGAPAGLAYGGGAAWVSVDYGAAGQQGSLLKFTPGTSGISAVVPLSDGLGAVAFGFGSVWVLNHNDGTVIRVDPQTAAVTATITGLHDPEAIALDGRSVWVADTLDSALYRIDPGADQASAPIALLAEPDALAAGGGAIWAVSSSKNLLLRIDPASNSETASLQLPQGPSAVAYGSGLVWVAVATTGEVVRFDPRSNRDLGAALHVQGAPSSIFAEPAGIWVAVQSS